MSMDCSRFPFNPLNDYQGVVSQQGRVQLDSDWNEWLAEINRRIQAGTMDTVGHAVYPATTPGAFQIGLSGGSVTIGPGRMYVDGLLAENHGLNPQNPNGTVSSLPWDPALAELSAGASGKPLLNYSDQPYFPSPDALPTDKNNYLFYLDVWYRTVSFLQDSNLVEKAVGVDTTGRVQIAWQVKCVQVDASVTCSTPDASIPAWQNIIQPSGARLTSRPGATGSPGPCCLTPNTGYTGMENQLYRIEVGQSGGHPTFKWSRDNASVMTAVTLIGSATSKANNPASRLTVQSTGKDTVLCFAPGDWIEIIDDYLELRGLPGEVHQIDVNGVDKVNKTVTLADQVSTALQNRLQNPPANYPNLHTRIIRWDQKGKVYKADSQTLWCDLDDPTNTNAAVQVTTPGEIPIPSDNTFLLLEDGITISFNGSTSYHSRDFWTIAARSSDAYFDLLTSAPPQGIHHHYARLAIANLSAGATTPSPNPTDCRIEWPPANTGGGDCACECTVTVQPGDLTANNTLGNIIQNAITKYGGLQQGVVICLMPGTYSLPGTVYFPAGFTPVTLKSCVEGAAVLQPLAGSESQFADGLLALNGANNVTLSGLQFYPKLGAYKLTQFAGVPAGSFGREMAAVLSTLMVAIGIRAVNCTGLTLENCSFDFEDMESAGDGGSVPDGAISFSAGVFAGGQCADWQITANEFAGIEVNVGILLAPTVVKFNLPRQNKVPIIYRKLPDTATPGKTPVDVTPEVLLKQKTAVERPSVLEQLAREQQIFAFGTAAPVSAGNGGTVLPASLDEAVFEKNSFSGMNVAVLILGQTGVIDFTRNECDNGSAGFWLVTPTQFELLNFDLQPLDLIGLSIAMGYPTAQAAPAQTLPPTPPVPVVVAKVPAAIRIYPGTARKEDSSSNVWSTDASASITPVGTGTDSTTAAISNRDTTDQFIYQSERYGPSFTYTFDKLPVGYYDVTLHFAETYYTTAGATNSPRIFNVSINDTLCLATFDIVADAGGPLLADDKDFANIVPAAVANNAGQITIQFAGTTDGADHNAKISAIEVIPQWSEAAITSVINQGSASGAVYSNLYTQLSVLAQQAYAVTPAPPLRLRLTDNELQGLSSTGFLVLWDDQLQNGDVSSLMMTGNRLSMSMPRLTAALETLRSLWKQALAGGQINPQLAVDLASLYFYFGVTIQQVTRCVVSGNMFLSLPSDANIKSYVPNYGCFLLNDFPLPSGAVVNVPPEVMAAGNVFQGFALALPLPNSFTTVNFLSMF